MVFSADGTTLYVAALGSAAVAVLDAAQLEAGAVSKTLIPVGDGPSGLALDAAHDRLFVMNRIGHSMSMITHLSDPRRRAETGRLPLPFDPSPASAKNGRRFLYDAAHTSGHGDEACASCHVFGDLDGLAWDLGDPFAPVVPNPNPMVPGITARPFHPMKGPMTTQSLRGLASAGAMHWRGDRTGAADAGGDAFDEVAAFAQFNPAFVTLLGNDRSLTAPQLRHVHGLHPLRAVSAEPDPRVRRHPDRRPAGRRGLLPECAVRRTPALQHVPRGAARHDRPVGERRRAAGLQDPAPPQRLSEDRDVRPGAQRRKPGRHLRRSGARRRLHPQRRRLHHLSVPERAALRFRSRCERQPSQRRAVHPEPRHRARADRRAAGDARRRSRPRVDRPARPPAGARRRRRL